jgi:phosphocarrier protein
MLVKLAAKFKSNIQLERDGFEINAKSIVGVMTLAAEFGSTLELEIDGDDEQEAMDAIVELFETGFGELT